MNNSFHRKIIAKLFSSVVLRDHLLEGEMATTKKGVEFAKHIMDIIKCSTGFERHLEKVVHAWKCR